MTTGYNAKGELTSYTYPDGTAVVRSYTARGELCQLTHLEQRSIDTRVYDNGGRMTSSKPFSNTNPRWQSDLCQRSERIRRTVESNGVSETRAYNTENTLASIIFSGASIGNLSYGWDANKNKTSEVRIASCLPSPCTQQASCSDSKSRLPSPRTRGEGLGVRGSSIGEDRSLVLTRTHGPTHELLTAGGQNISTDVKGNITFIPASLRPTASSLTSVWDFDNRLNTADVGSDGSVDVTYKFDAIGRRVFRDNGTTATIYVQAGQQTIADYTASSAPSSPTYRYVYASYIDEPVLRFKPSGSESLYYHRNQQYSVVALTNSSAAIVERYAYSAYGVPTITNASGTLLPVGSVDNRYLYTGREWDQTLSLYHYRARMYDANLGRFASRDPIAYRGNSLNLVSFLSSRPMVAVDPSGKAAVLCTFKCKELGPGHDPIDDVEIETDCLALGETCCEAEREKVEEDLGKNRCHVDCKLKKWKLKDADDDHHPPSPCYVESCKLSCSMEMVLCQGVCSIVAKKPAQCITLCATYKLACDQYCTKNCVPGWDPTDPYGPNGIVW